ncbi:hypothetical protein [Rhizobium bangladeshense]|uniref:hypothetical protein n=1 Tax=Rhizobium bangladeshense TaxID=1138189 RepID=UPI000AF9878C|nr:hypothetical protein [Rhizobium bangladeshense]
MAPSRRPLVEKGDLARFTDLVVADPGAYYLTWNNTRELPAAALSLRDWIRMLAEEERSAPMPLARQSPETVLMVALA